MLVKKEATPKGKKLKNGMESEANSLMREANSSRNDFLSF